MLQYTTLSMLGRGGALSNAQLARRAYMSPQAMSEVIEALEAKRAGRAEAAPEPSSRLPRRGVGEGPADARECEAAVDELEAEMLRGLDAAARRGACGTAWSRVRALHAGFPDGVPPNIR